jgi:hypothetical protein
MSDFGEINMVYSRFSRTRSALVVDPDMWKLCYYQPFKTEALAKTGHSDRKLLSVEFTLEACNELSSGIVADLTTTSGTRTTVNIAWATATSQHPFHLRSCSSGWSNTAWT